MMASLKEAEGLKMAFRNLAAQSDCNRHKTLQMFLSTPPIADRLRGDTRYEVEHRVGVSSGTSNVRHCSVHAITDTKLPMVYYVFEHFVASNMMWHAVISKKQRFDEESPLKRSDKESGLRAMPTLAKKMTFCQSLKYCYAHHEKVCQTHTKNDKTVVNTDTTLAQTHHCERCLQKRRPKLQEKLLPCGTPRLSTSPRADWAHSKYFDFNHIWVHVLWTP